MNSWEWKD